MNNTQKRYMKIPWTINIMWKKTIRVLKRWEKKFNTRKFITIIWYCVLITIWLIIITPSETEANDPVYKTEICTTDKCKSRVSRLNECNWDIDCAVNLTIDASYDYLYTELANLEKVSSEEVKTTEFDINKLAYAVAMQETKDCTLGYGKTHNNCFWIKHWNTVPCPGVPKMAMCKFKTKEESYEAFKIIWQKWYGELPNYEMAKRWSWDDRAWVWLYNVLHFYNS